MSYSAATGAERYELYACAARLVQGINPNEDFGGDGIRNDADVEDRIDELEAAISAVNSAT